MPPHWQTELIPQLPLQKPAFTQSRSLWQIVWLLPVQNPVQIPWPTQSWGPRHAMNLLTHIWLLLHGAHPLCPGCSPPQLLPPGYTQDTPPPIAFGQQILLFGHTQP